MNLGKRLRYARNWRRWTQEQLSELTGASQARISALEKRDSKSTEFLFQFADALKVDPRWLLEGGDIPSGLDGPPAEPAISRDALQLARRIAKMPEVKQKLLMEIFSSALQDDDPRLKGWEAPQDQESGPRRDGR